MYVEVAPVRGEGGRLHACIPGMSGYEERVECCRRGDLVTSRGRHKVRVCDVTK